MQELLEEEFKQVYAFRLLTSKCHEVKDFYLPSIQEMCGETVFLRFPQEISCLKNNILCGCIFENPKNKKEFVFLEILKVLDKQIRNGTTTLILKVNKNLFGLNEGFDYQQLDSLGLVMIPTLNKNCTTYKVL